MFRVHRSLLWAACLALPGLAWADSASLLTKAQAADPTRYAFALAKNAEVRNTSDNKSFTMWWQPSGSSPPKGVIVPLHGHDGFATDGIYLWQAYAEKYGYAILSLQWWIGSGEATADYYTPDEIYPILASRLADKGVKPGTAFFNGFSRGSANSYAVAARDAAATGGRYFGLVLSNSGGAMTGYPPNQEIDAGKFGSKPFSGVKWSMYCGELDPDPTINGCPAMNAARTWVTKYGATVVLFIDDPKGDHGGFMLNSANVEAALGAFASALASVAAPPSCTLAATPSSIALGSSATLTATCNPVATAFAWKGGTCAGTSGASCTVSPSATTTYSVAGSSTGGWGLSVSATVAVADTTPPTVPAGLKAAAVDGAQVNLSWTASTDNVAVSGYRVLRDGVQVGSPTGTSYTDSALKPATSYTYTVTACDAAGNCSAASAGVGVQTLAASNVLSTTEADCLFNWGEDSYPTTFTPRRPASTSAAPYYYRRYTGTNVYLGVSSTDNHLVYLDAKGVLNDLGLAATWSTQARCR